MKAIYINLSDVSELQKSIMIYVEIWVKKEKIPVPLKEIILNMETQGNKTQTVIKAINSLVKKGYIRRAITISNRSSFVQLRRL